MRSTIWATVVASSVLWMGCPAPVPGECKADQDCATGEYCSPEHGMCLESDSDGGTDGGGGDTCSPTCEAWQECVGTVCEARYESVNLTSPADGTTVAPDAQVAVTAALTLAAGKTANAPATVDLEVTDPVMAKSTKTLTKSGDNYTGTVTVGASGTYTLVAKYAGLSSAEVKVTVDSTPPVFAVAVGAPGNRPASGTTVYEDPSGNAWRRDESVVATVTSDASDVDDVTVKMTASIAGGAPLTVTVNKTTGCGQAWCGTATIDLWKPEMKAFRGDLSVKVDGKDKAGNAAAQKEATAKVTRWKWAYTASTTDAMKTSPAIAADGTVVVGTAAGSGTAGKLVAINPDGTQRWEKSLGAITASPAIGAAGTVYVAANDGTGAGLWAFGLDGTAIGSVCRPTTQGPVNASPLVTMSKVSADAQPVETAVTVIKTANWLLSLRPGSSASCLSNLANDGADHPSSVVGKGADLYHADPNGRVQGYSFTTAGWAEKNGWPVDAALFTHALALVGTDVVGGGGPGKGGLFTIPQAGNVTQPAWQYTTTSPAWNPAVGPGNQAVVGLNNSTLVSTTLGSNPATPLPATPGIIQAAPAFGEGGRLYMASSTGHVFARSFADPSADLWDVGLGSTAGVEGGPALDCSRAMDGTALGSMPGIMYVATATGKLYSVVVDSRGIDTTAPWPKYQHDPRNTGNADTQLAQFACP